MTIRKKLLITIACLSVILCTLLTGTIAWLTDNTDAITNEFKPSIVSIKLTEEGLASNSNTQYFKMVPGVVRDKKATVTVTNDIDCYVFLKVEKKNNYDDFIKHAIADGWNPLDGEDGIYYREVTADATTKQFGILGAGSFNFGEKVFTWANDQVLIRPDITKEKMAEFYNEDGTEKTGTSHPALTFTAYACQKEGFASPAEAWAEASE